MPRPPRVVHLDEIETIPGPGTLTWHPVRAHLGLRAFGTNAYTAQRVGDDVVEPHDENPDLVLSFGRPPTFEPSAWEWMFRGVALAESDPVQARAIVEDGLEQHPESPGLRVALARILLREGDEEGARAEVGRGDRAPTRGRGVRTPGRRAPGSCSECSTT